MFAFFAIVGALSFLVTPPGWPQALLALGIIATVIAQGLLNHQRTDDLIAQEAKLRTLNDALVVKQAVIEQQNERLGAEVRARTEDLRQANVRLAQRNLELIELDSSRVALLSNASHELKTPLTCIRGAAENLRDGVAGTLTDDQSEYVEMVVDQSGRLLRVVNDFLSAGRIESGKLELNLESFDALQLAREVADSAAREAEVSIRGDAVVIDADRQKVSQVLQNLIDNAVKYGNGARVDIELHGGADEVQIEVRDHGAGIEADELPLLFERFFRARRTFETPGTGLGLAISRNLARLHGGDITVESVAGQGAAFTLHLPVPRKQRGAA